MDFIWIVQSALKFSSKMSIFVEPGLVQYHFIVSSSGMVIAAATPSPLPETGDIFSPEASSSSETSLTSLHLGSSFGEH